MAQQRRGFPFRWVLPSAQLLVCFVILWPMRDSLLFELLETVRSYAPARAAGRKVAEEQRVLILPSFTLTPEEEQARNAGAKVTELRIRAPIVLNFPVLVAQLPYVLVVPAKKEWVPRVMSAVTWRALSWPFAGIVFWWFAGRGIEALVAARRSVVYPRLSRIETLLAVILFFFGLVAFIGALMSTPDDRSDLQFMALLAGGWLWGILASLTIAARFLQWRLLKRIAPAQPTTSPPPP
jgi:hypothetical protein